MENLIDHIFFLFKVKEETPDDDIEDIKPTQSIEDDEETNVKVTEKENTPEVNNRGFKVKKETIDAKKEADKDNMKMGWSIKKSDSKDSVPSGPEVKIDPGKLPIITNDKGDKVLRMYWLDAYEDQYRYDFQKSFEARSYICQFNF